MEQDKLTDGEEILSKENNMLRLLVLEKEREISRLGKEIGTLNMRIDSLLKFKKVIPEQIDKFIDYLEYGKTNFLKNFFGEENETHKK